MGVKIISHEYFLLLDCEEIKVIEKIQEADIWGQMKHFKDGRFSQTCLNMNKETGRRGKLKIKQTEGIPRGASP